MGKDQGLVIENLSKKYYGTLKRTRVLENVDLSIDKGSVYALIGQNGSGKTTTIKCLLNFLRKYKGKILCEGQPIKYYQEKAMIGYAPENLNFINDATLDEFMESICSLKKINNADEQLEKLYKLFELEKYRKVQLRKMSKGTKRKVCFIQAVIGDPYIVILDEPTDGLDPISRGNILKYVDELAKNGKYVLITSHLLSDLCKVCDKIGLLSNGSIVGEYEVVKNLDSIEKIEIIRKDGEKEFAYLDDDFHYDCDNIKSFSYLKTYTREVDVEKWYFEIVSRENRNI